MTAHPPKIRLFVEHAPGAGASLTLSGDQRHYARNVMRLGAGDHVAVFNGSDGEWEAEIVRIERRSCAVRLVASLRAQTAGADLWLVFAPLKWVGTDFLAANATELGVSALWPVLTARTEVKRVNVARQIGRAHV